MKREEVIDILKWSIAKRRSRIPVRVFDVLDSIDTLTPGFDGPVIQKAQKYFNFLADGNLIILAGNVGIGKTVAACFLASMLRRSQEWTSGDDTGITWYAPEWWFVPAQMIIRNSIERDVLPAGMGGGKRRLQECRDILVVDDLGREHMPAGWSVTQMDEWFDSRYRNKLPTVATTNLNEHEFQHRYGERVWDRFQEWGKWIYTEGESLRGTT